MKHVVIKVSSAQCTYLYTFKMKYLYSQRITGTRHFKCYTSVQENVNAVDAVSYTHLQTKKRMLEIQHIKLICSKILSTIRLTLESQTCTMFMSWFNSMDLTDGEVILNNIYKKK